MGELLVEIMRPRAGLGLERTGPFVGPFPSGAPAIFADTVARLGHSAGIIGGVGEDEFGRCLLKRLAADGVEVEHVLRSPQGATAVAFVTYEADGSRRFIYHIDGTPAVQAVLPDPPPPAREARFFHVMGCSLMANDRFRAEIVRAARYFHEAGAKISFDPNIRPELLGGREVTEVAGPILERCAILLPGAAELRLLSGKAEEAAAVAALFGWPQLELIVLKRGKAGATVYTRAGEAADSPSYPVEEVDPTGAGDCFDAGFLCGLLEGRPPQESARLGAAAGALNAAAFGPMEGRISREAVRRMMEGRPQT